MLLFGQLLVLLFNLPIPFGKPVEGQGELLPKRGVLHALGHDRGALPRIDSGLREKPAQPRSLPLQRNGPLRRPANLPDFIAGGLQLRPAALADGVQAACALPGPHLPPGAAPRSAPPRPRPGPARARKGTSSRPDREPTPPTAARRRRRAEPAAS